MAHFKNVSYMPVEVVLDDTKTVIRFLPGEVKEIVDADGMETERIAARYPKMIEKFDPAAEREKFEKEQAKLEAVVPGDDKVGGQNPLECLTCGFVAKSKLGLMSHSKTHKEEDVADIL